VEEDGVVGAARRVNDRQAQRVAHLIENEVDKFASPRILLVGAAYKAEVGDTRNAPAIQIHATLSERGIDVAIYDPLTRQYSGDLLAMAAGVDLIAVLVPHRRVVDELRRNADRITAAMRRARLLDFSTGTAREFLTPGRGNGRQ
jgi:UDP-N-acetyl-D-mannosaminuronate dehydrogenase